MCRRCPPTGPPHARVDEVSISILDRWWGLVLAALLAAGTCSDRIVVAEDLFRDVVAPILQRRCLSCHDDQRREGDLSLQQSASAIVDGFIEPGHPETSRLIQAITPVGSVADMPKDADPLSQSERDAIAKWIAAGAPWPSDVRLEEAVVTDLDWWSFQPIRRSEVPDFSSNDVDGSVSPETELKRDDFPIRNPIDAFVLAELRSQGLSTSPPADRRTLLRRLTYDLIGLPPTPEQVESFVHDPDPQAYEKRVDELLDSPHYGERWAQHWLDVVKYADTCGYDKDKPRPSAWPYRDYVIRSFNSDKSFTRFVQEQIAGDVLFPGDPDGVLGLGFLAAGPWDFIGHVEVSESKLDGKVARNLDRDDMMSSTINTFCSLTVQCARCHHHKFDPITQQQYYGLQAIFAAVDRAERAYDLDPKIVDQRLQIQSEIARYRETLQQITTEIAEAGGERLTEASQRVQQLQQALQVDKNARFGYHSQIAGDAATEKWVEVDLGQDRELTQIVLHPCHDEFAGIGAGFGFPKRYRVDVAADQHSWRTILDRTTQDQQNPGLDAIVLDVDSQPIRRIRVIATQLSTRQDDFIFAIAELEARDANGQNLALNQQVSALDSIEAPERWSQSNLTDGFWAKFVDATVARQWAEAKRELDAITQEIETPDRSDRRADAQKLLAQAEANLASLPTGKMVYAAATHFAKQGNFQPTNGVPRPIHVLDRGEIHRPLEPAIPGMLPIGTDVPWQLEPDSDEGQRRAALATWLTDRSHPLTWRSIVNRIWQHHFGEGIVATPNDFGRMGAEPSHPELLDWLAVEFRDGGRWVDQQSIKSLHRLMVTSSVYRQSSQHQEASAAIDGNNRYLWRMNRRRLEAEEIRDSILFVSGALNPEAGGAGYQLFELERPEHSPHYEYHKFDPSDPATHRRSIYRFVVRSQPDPWMTTLDCADSSQSTPRRTETLTALQALSLLNNQFNLVLAKKFAERLQQESADPAQQVRRGFQLVTQRAPDDEQLQRLIDYSTEHGMPNTCRLLINLSEFLYLD